MQKEENNFMLKDGEIDNRQCAGKHSNSLYINAQKTVLHVFWESPILRQM